MKTVSRRILVSLLALTMLTALLAGCSDSQGQSGTGAKTSITIMLSLIHIFVNWGHAVLR